MKGDIVMAIENIIFAATSFLCSLIFGVIALWAFKRKEPMHFWSGTTVSAEEIRDIPSYNRANGWMWTIYTLCIFVTAILSFFSIKIAAILLVIICIPGIGVLIFAYNRIYKKYSRPSFINKSYDFNSKSPKGVIIAITAISVLIFIVVGLLLFNGEKDPKVSIHDDSLEIKGMYGLDIAFSEITDISLIENSMSNVDFGKRTNGFSGFGGALKGNFKSDTIGESLIFVQSQSSPTIKIQRTDNKRCLSR